MEFFAYHGCFREEQIIGNKFIVNLELETNTAAAEKTDQLGDTVNYQAVYNTVSIQMKEKSHLLEHIGRRILDAVSSEFPEISHMKLSISKLNPPMGGKMHAVTVELER